MKPTLTISKRGEQLLSQLINRARSEIQVSATGALSSKLHTLPEISSLCSLCLVAREEIETYAMRSAIDDALRKILQDKNLTENDFVDACRASLQRRMQRPKEKFCYWGGLNFKPRVTDGNHKILIDDCLITFGPKLPKRIDDAPLEKLMKASVYDHVDDRSFIWAYGDSSSELSAGWKLSRAVDKLTALINFQRHYRGKISVFGGPRQLAPRVIFEHGPTYFLKNMDTGNWSETIWMADSFNPRLWREKERRQSDLLPALNAIRSHNRAISRSPFKPRLERTLLNLNESWSAPHRDHWATGLWKAIESLFSDPSSNNSQESLLKRAVNGVDGGERSIFKQRLEYIAELRNSAVHAHRKVSDTDSMQFIIQWANLYIIECYVELLLIHRRGIRNESEYIGYVELPPNSSELKRRIKVARAALKAI